MFPLMVKAKNKRTVVLLWIPSLVVWLLAQFGLRSVVDSLFPHWVYHGFFDPYGWQFAYFTGAATIAFWKRAGRKIFGWCVLRRLFCLRSLSFVSCGRTR